MTYRLRKIYKICHVLVCMMVPVAYSQDFQNYGVNKMSSVLSSGTWYKIKIKNDGIYKLTYEDIRNMGFADPSLIRIFGNGGAMIPFMNSVPRKDDLSENPIYMHKGSDGIFNSGDFILFYGKGIVSWSYNPTKALFEHRINQYSDAAYYFLTTDIGEGKRIQIEEVLQYPPDKISSSFNDYSFHEKNRVNVLKSGRLWLGERLDIERFDTIFNFAGILGDPVILQTNVASRSSGTRTFTLKDANKVIGSIEIPGVRLTDKNGIYANQNSGKHSFSPTNDLVNINIDYNDLEGSDEGYLDYIRLNFRRKLILTSDLLFFRDVAVIGEGAIAKFIIENCNNGTEVWNVTDFTNIKRMSALLNGTVLTFHDYADSLQEYVVINPLGNFPKPIINSALGDLGDVPNQNLHATVPVQMLIITHPLFREAADSIALFHKVNDNMSVLVVNTDMIYNEFSSGAYDAGALRDFTKMVYDRGTNENNKLKYLLLVGDGSYNNISRSAGNPNFIPTYQSESSLNASLSYVTDDFYGTLGDEEGGSENMHTFALNIGVGRLPVKTAQEAMVQYRKIRSYNRVNNMRDWRNNILFVADDEDGNLHMRQANDLAEWVRINHPQFVVKKIFLDAYQQEASSIGARYPEVTRELIDNIHKGILIYNYTGHGGELGITDERILMKEDLVQLSNAGNLPLFVTATCKFTRFDDLSVDSNGDIVELTSAGEISLLNENGGNIALLSTTRIVYSSQNFDLNQKFLNVVFQRDIHGHYYRLGDIVRMTKNLSGNQRNKLSFGLFGDPALKLALPEYTVHTDSINGNSVNSIIDTVTALTKVRISGHVEDINHNIAGEFNGTIYPSVFDKKRLITTLANDGGTPFQFFTQENLLFKGKASVIKGNFSFSFLVPKDILYSYDNGKIVYYSKDTGIDANGYFDRFMIGGSDSSFLTDESGPEIFLYLNDNYFLNRGISNSNPVIFARLNDASGINITGNGIGHNITGILDDDESNPIILNNYFENNLNDFTEGTLTYPLSNLAEGWHSLKIKAWDVMNNSSEKTISFRVVINNEPVLTNISNYPNPASRITVFRFEHNRPDENLRIIINIFDLTGRNVATIDQYINSTGFGSPPLEWDLRDKNGKLLNNGIYPYSVRIIDSNGRFALNHSKLMILQEY